MFRTLVTWLGWNESLGLRDIDLSPVVAGRFSRTVYEMQILLAYELEFGVEFDAMARFIGADDPPEYQHDKPDTGSERRTAWDFHDILKMTPVVPPQF